jgi:hypothetical protein
VPQALLQRIPPGGYTREQLEPVLKKSHYAAALKYGAMLCNSTGNYFLDADEECADNSCDNWDKGLVEDAALEWKAAEAVLASTHKRHAPCQVREIASDGWNCGKAHYSAQEDAMAVATYGWTKELTHT